MAAWWLLAGTALASGAQAQATDPVAAPPAAEDAALAPDLGGSEDIVVTAQKRSERAQDVPISLSSFSQESLERANVTSVLDLAKVTPSFSAYRATQAANTRLAIRGIGTAGNSAVEPSVGAFVDGIYVPRPGPLLAGLNDVASVEVLRGPQGTLFGRNASVGAISFSTGTPENSFFAETNAQVGNYGLFRGTAVVTGPLAEDVAGRVSVLFNSTGGYGHNRLTGKRFGYNDTLSLRGSIKAVLAPNLTWLVRGDYQRQDGDGAALQTVDAATVTPLAAANFNRVLNGQVPVLDDTYSLSMRQVTAGNLDDEQYGLSSDLSLDLGGYTLRLLSGARRWDNLQSDDNVALTPSVLLGRNAIYESRSHSEELQLTSPAGDRLNFVAGLYYFHEDYRIGGDDASFGPDYCGALIRNTRPALLAGCLAGPQTGVAATNFLQSTRSLAAYGQATFRITPTWDVTGGLRYSHDRKRADFTTQIFNPAAVLIYGPDQGNLAFDGGKVTYRLGTTYRPMEDVLLFATYSTGYKSGGFDASTGATLGTNRVFRPELTTNYELGAKTQWLDRRVTANVTLFRMDIDDFQLRSFNGFGFSVTNAGSIRQQGAEFELSTRPVRGLSLGVSGTYLDGTYTDFATAPALPGRTGVQDLTGTRTTFSPTWQGAATADWRTTVSDTLGVNLTSTLSFTSDVDVGGGSDGNPQGIQQGYALWQLRAALFSAPDNRWEVAINADNVTDKRYCTLKFSQTFGGLLGTVGNGTAVQRCVLGDPRTIKGSVRLRF